MKIDKKRVIEEWKERNGAADFDLDKEDIILFDGGLFSIKKEKVMRNVAIGTKKLPGGAYKILVTKKKYPVFDYTAIFWMSELDDVINYFKRMKKMLNRLGYKTNPRGKNEKK